MSHSEQFWPFFLCFGLGSLIIVSNLALGVRLKFPDMSRDSGRWINMETLFTVKDRLSAAALISFSLL